MAEGPGGADHAGGDAQDGSKRNDIKDERSYRADGESNAASEDKSSSSKDIDEEEEEPPKKKGLLERPILLTFGAVIFLVAIVLGLVIWLNGRHYQTTDDAFVDTHIVRLAPQIAGRVTQVLVNDNQLVGVNQPLVTIDSADVQTRVAQADAQRAQAQAQVDNARVQISINKASYEAALADARASAAQANNAARDLTRYLTLQRLNAAAVSQQQLDQAAMQARQTSAQRDSAFKGAKAKAAQVEASRTQVTSGEDQVRAAQSMLNEANINLGYAHIVAPETGHIAMKTVAVGNYVQQGTQLMAIVPLSIWITANFKETQLALMRPGQRATVKVDACPKADIEGHVDSIQRGAGQAFGILPPENATGNYVKVVQRVPVKIVLDRVPGDCPLGPGMSVEPKVRVR